MDEDESFGKQNTRKKPWCFEHGTFVKSEASDKDAKDNPFLPNEKKPSV